MRGVMFSTKSVVGALLGGSLCAEALKFGLLSDLHINLTYDSDLSSGDDNRGDCIEGSGIHTDVKAYLGRYGCDPPVALLE